MPPPKKVLIAGRAALARVMADKRSSRTDSAGCVRKLFFGGAAGGLEQDLIAVGTYGRVQHGGCSFGERQRIGRADVSDERLSREPAVGYEHLASVVSIDLRGSLRQGCLVEIQGAGRPVGGPLELTGSQIPRGRDRSRALERCRAPRFHPNDRLQRPLARGHV